MLPRWRRRVLAYRLIDALPGGERVVDWYKVSLGGVRRFDLARRRYLPREMVMLLAGARTTVEGKDLLEIGAGWHPLLPVLLHGMGARSIVMTDIRAHMRRTQVEQTIDSCVRHVDEIAALVGVDAASLLARWTDLQPRDRSWTDAWKASGIAYAAPLDFMSSGLAAASFDIVYSNSCLNYIPAAELQGIAAESSRILKPGGIALHDISVYDDLSGSDPSIPVWNFLRYTETEWERTGNTRAHYQNRWRPRAYAALMERNGMRLVWDERVGGSDGAPDLERSLLDPAFRDLPAEEILCRHYLLAAEKPAARPAGAPAAP